MSGDAGKQGTNSDNCEDNCGDICEDNEKILFRWEPNVFAKAVAHWLAGDFVCLFV